MKKTIFIVFFVFAIAYNGVSQEESVTLTENRITLTFYDDNQYAFYTTYFQYVNFPYTENGMFMEITYNINLLRSILQIEKLKIDVINDNINERTTEASSQYKRKYVDITLEDGIKVIEEPESTTINIHNEYKDMVNAALLFNSIVDYFQRNNRGIIIEKIPITQFLDKL